jgi:RimJ/RimL family protein N-acetyltransferase
MRDDFHPRFDIELVPFTRADCAALVAWVRDPLTLYRWAGDVFTFPLDEDQLARELCEPARAMPTYRSFMAWDRAQGKPVGFCQLSDIWPSLSARVSGVLVGEQQERGRGIGAAIVKLALEEAFVVDGVDRVDLGVERTNEAAVRCYVKCGFVHVGRWRNAANTPIGMLDVDWMTCYRNPALPVQPHAQASSELELQGAEALA